MLIKFWMCLAKILDNASTFARTSSTASDTVCSRSLGISFLKLADILKAAFPLMTSKDHFNTCARKCARLSRSTSNFPPKIPILSLTWLTNRIIASAPARFPPNAFRHSLRGPKENSRGLNAGMSALFLRIMLSLLFRKCLMA